jgi:hypothetical protein
MRKASSICVSLDRGQKLSPRQELYSRPALDSTPALDYTPALADRSQPFPAPQGAACESPARQCRVATKASRESRRDGTLALTALVRVLAVVLACALFSFAADKSDKSKTALHTVDSGSLGVFVKGQRVLTETFTIQEGNGNSTVHSHLKEAAGTTPPTDQKSVLEIAENGGLVRYEWSQAGGGSLVVLPNNEFLIEKITATAAAKPAEQPFLMPNTTAILDNNFFVQREVLAWRYLATAPCRGESVKRQCEPQEFGALVPQDRASVRVKMALVGKEKVNIRGAERELLRLNLTGEGFDWALWLDENDRFKLMRIAIPADNTEVVRD